MPRIIPPEVKKQIKEYALSNSKNAAAKKFNVTWVTVHAIVEGKRKRNDAKVNKIMCPITGGYL